MRSLCIAAYLRCLHAAIEYAPKPYLEEAARKELRDDSNFIEVTQLCATTGWFEANIGTKYLKVFRNVLKLEYSRGHEKVESLLKYQIFAVVVKKILMMLKGKILTENESLMLNESDKILICELSTICYEMVYQCSLFPWQEDFPKF